MATSHKILVTGGAGFLGSHICEKLLLSGKQVVVVDNFNDETSSLSEKKKYIKSLEEISLKIEGAILKTYKIDILNEDRLCEIIKEEAPTDCVHAAALVMDRKSVEEPIRYITNNVIGTQSLLNAIQKTGTVKRFVYISSRSAVGETLKINDKITEDVLLRPINPYGATKVAAEALCHVFHENFGLSVAICRMQPLYGPRSRIDMMPSLLIESILTQKKSN
jgi:UDP-glucuronate 4-epimerase